MRLHKSLLFLMFLSFFCLFSEASEKEIFTTSYECFDLKGSLRWQASTEIFSSPEKGEGMGMLIERGKGLYSGFKEEISWQSELEYIRQDGEIRPVKSRTETFNALNELICIESQEFDYDSGIATFKRDDKKSGKEHKEVFRIKEDIISRLMLSIYVQELLKSGKTETVIQVLSNEPKLIKCRLYMVGEEEIDISGEKQKALKICLDPQLGLFNFMKVFIPRAYMWYSAGGDFKWLQYKGLEDNLSSPVVEIKKIKDDSI